MQKYLLFQYIQTIFEKSITKYLRAVSAT